MIVENFIRTDYPKTDEHMNAGDLIKTDVSHSETYIPVVDDKNHPTGIVHINRLIGANPTTSVSALMDKNFIKLQLNHPIIELLKLDYSQLQQPMVVIDDKGKLAGILPCEKWVEISLYLNGFYRQVLDTLNKAMVVVDDQGFIYYVSKKWESIHGISRIEGEYVGTRFPESGLIDVIKTGSSHINQKISFSSTGVTVLPVYKPILNESNHISGGIAVVENETDLNRFKLVAQNIVDIEKNLSIIFQSLNDAIVITNLAGDVYYTNNSFNVMFSQEILPESEIAVELINKTIDKIKSKDGYQNEDIEIRMHSFYKFLNVTAIPITNLVDEIHGIILIMKDLTQVVSLNKELNKKNAVIQYFNETIIASEEKIIGESPQLKSLLKMVLKVAGTDASVLITGENGVGKELLAKSIHFTSNRKDKPFVCVNCGAIPETLWESEMFGYEEGAFTGSKKGGKLGKFQIAHTGTLFLDEISEMPLSSQVKLLRVLQNMQLDKVGSEVSEKVDVRIIAATNKDLKEMVRNGQFREDLFYRINVFHLHIPPLRERKQDIKAAVNYFLHMFNAKYKKNIVMHEKAMDLLTTFEWPGNIRELKNVIEHGVIMAERNFLEPEHLPEELKKNHTGNLPIKGTLEEAVKNTERTMIIKALHESNNNKTLAMKRLNISRRTFYKKLQELSIENL